MIQAVIFDMDGVLIDSEPLHSKAEIHALGAFGLSLTMEDIKPYVGANRDTFRNGLTKKFGVPIDWDAVFAKKDELFYTLIEDVKPIPGALPFVRALKEAGFKLGMATSSQERIGSINCQKIQSGTIVRYGRLHYRYHPQQATPRNFSQNSGSSPH